MYSLSGIAVVPSSRMAAPSARFSSASSFIGSSRPSPLRYTTSASDKLSRHGFGWFACLCVLKSWVGLSTFPCSGGRSMSARHYLGVAKVERSGRTSAGEVPDEIDDDVGWLLHEDAHPAGVADL